jgi:hypothetical protein
MSASYCVPVVSPKFAHGARKRGFFPFLHLSLRDRVRDYDYKTWVHDT